MNGVNTPLSIIVHHDGVSRSGPSFDIINDFHRSRGFPLSSLGFYGGYHYLIERGGSICQYRKEQEIGAHTVGMNDKSIGICLAGNMDLEDPSPAQVASLGELLSDVVQRHKIDPFAIRPHRAYANKTCYGSRLNGTWAALVFLRYEYVRLTLLIKQMQEV